MALASWYEKLKEAMESDGENFESRVCTLDEAALKKQFDGGYGSIEGDSFTAWDERRVYFPICYDGAEWVGHAPRNPCDISMDHQGGG